MLFAKKRSDLNNVILDSWSGVHAAYGMSMKLLNIPLKHAAIYAVAWEIIENSNIGTIIWDAMGHPNYAGDALPNIISDVFFACFFHKLSKRIGLKKSVLLINICFLYFQVYDAYLWNIQLENCGALQNMVEIFSHGCV